MSKRTIFQRKPLTKSEGVTISCRVCRRCQRTIPDDMERCVCMPLYEIRDHFERMFAADRFQVLCELANGYCGYCGDKLRERRNEDCTPIVGDYEACHCTNDE